MNDREQLLLEREQRRRESYTPPAPEMENLEVTMKERAHLIRAFWVFLVDEGFDENQALLLTGRLYRD